MDTSVNMKMLPNEHRLLVSAVEESRDIALAISQSLERELRPGLRIARKVGDPAFNGQEARDARERVTKLNDLLARL